MLQDLLNYKNNNNNNIKKIKLNQPVALNVAASSVSLYHQKDQSLILLTQLFYHFISMPVCVLLLNTFHTYPDSIMKT